MLVKPLCILRHRVPGLLSQKSSGNTVDIEDQAVVVGWKTSCSFSSDNGLEV